MAEDRSRYWSPSRTYEFVLKIGDIDLTPDLVSLKIYTSIDVPYQTFILQLYLDSADIILQKIYGQTPLKLTSKMFGTAPYIAMETIEFELMYLSSDMPVETTVPVNAAIQQKDREPINITCVSRKAYTTMNTLVNSVYQGQRISSVISNLVSLTGGRLKIDTQGSNTEVIDQILIPSSTLYKNLEYLNRTFGLYNGMAAIYCTHDNYVTIKNLTSKMKTSNKFIVYQLPLGVDNTKTIDSCNDGKRYYTTQNLQTKYKGNSAFAYMAPIMKHIVKPKDRLYYTITTDLESFCKTYGLISKGNKIFFDSQAIPSSKRVAIHKDHTGYELTSDFINAKYSRRVSSITEMMVHVEASMKILSLMDVGEAVKLDTKTEYSRDFTGLYIMRASNIYFTKGKDWESSADLFLMRTNRTTT